MNKKKIAKLSNKFKRNEKKKCNPSEVEICRCAYELNIMTKILPVLPAVFCSNQ